MVDQLVLQLEAREQRVVARIVDHQDDRHVREQRVADHDAEEDRHAGQLDAIAAVERHAQHQSQHDQVQQARS